MVPLLLLSGAAVCRCGPRGVAVRGMPARESDSKNLRSAVRRDYAVAMSDPIVILTEEPLGPDDRVNIAKLLDGGDAPLFVLVPSNTERHLLVDFLENLSLLDIAKAFRELTAQHPDPEVERAEASETLAASLAALAGLGGGVTGEVVDGGAVAGLVSKVRAVDAAQAVVITRPHAISDTFHTDWANKAQDQLGLPVLHLYAGSGFIGDS
ncbi:hypothetical protein ARTHRO9V_160315 [Arthrobacter sp. 9V]|nr:hypothetical protein ARTHRO9V_160315 [Arthrobacter sp. 9V]